jgi:hypothetical protein
MISSDERQFLINQLVWIGIYFGMNLPNTISNIISWYCREFLSTHFIAKKSVYRKNTPVKHMISIFRKSAECLSCFVVCSSNVLLMEL